MKPKPRKRISIEQSSCTRGNHELISSRMRWFPGKNYPTHTRMRSGESPWSDWVDETSLSPTHTAPAPTPRPKSRHTGHSLRHSTDAHPKRLRRGTTPKHRFWSNPERRLVIASQTSSDYDDVVLPQGDENEWETESETSDMDHRVLSDSNMAPGARRSLTEYDREDDVDGTGSRLHPSAPPRSVSTSRQLPSRHPTNSQCLQNPTHGSSRDCPRVSPKNSPANSPRASPIPKIVCRTTNGRSDSFRRRRRKASLDATIPPPQLGGFSHSRTGSGQCDCSGGSLFEESVADGQAPPTPPPRLSQGDYPMLPTRRVATADKEVLSAPAPPLPPRDSSVLGKALPSGDSPPPPTPPRQRTRTVENLAPDTIVPLSPEARQAGLRERDEQTGKPRLPPPRRKSTVPTPPTGSSPRRFEPTSSPVTVSDNNMLAEVPPPPPPRLKNKDDYVGPDPSLPEAPTPPRDGYLPMGNMAPPIRSHSFRPINETDENYIDPSDIDSWPGQTEDESKEPPEPFCDLWKRRDSDSENENYLTILPDEMPNDIPVRPPSRHLIDVPVLPPAHQCSSNRFVDEPLYQIYHFGAVARDVLDQHREEENSDEDDDLYRIFDDEVAVGESTDKIYETWEELTMSHTKSAAEIRSTLQNVIRTSTGVRTLWSEMPEVQESGILEKMSMDKRKFQETLFEIITSEASYLKSLKLLISHFMESPLLTEDIVSKHDKHILFSNLVAVHNVSERFMNELEGWWQEDFMLRPALCSLVTKYAAGDFQVYVTYCSNLSYQERKLRKLRDDNHIFREVLRQLERNPMCHGLPMQSFITMPMQRITRFPLLIDAVCKHMDEIQEEYKLVETALHTFQKLVRQCNEGARLLENLEQIADIDKKLKFKQLKKMAIVSQGRFLVKKGQLTHIRKDAPGMFIKKKKEQLYLYLFNDILIITKKKGEDHYQVIDYAARINCHAESVDLAHLTRALPHGAPGNCNNVFLMALLENHEKNPTDFYFTCESPSEQLRWVEAVTPAQQVNDDERIYEAWACPQVQTIYRYAAAEPDELSLEEADVINVLRKMADGWYEGERIRDGERGWFPANHTVEIQNERVRARNLLQRYRLLTHEANSPSGVMGSTGQSHTGARMRLEMPLLSSV